MKKLKLLIIPILIAILLFSGINAFAELHSKWSSGDLIFYDSTTNIWAIRDDTDGVKVYDDLNLTFGTDNDATIEYDEDGTDKLIITCSNGLTLAADLGYTGDILMATTSKIQFHDTGLYINASGNGAMVISSDGTLAVGATTSYTLTSPAVKFIATTSVVHEYDAASYVTQTVSDAGAVKVAVTGDSAGSYEIETDDAAITLDAANAISLDSGSGVITITGDLDANDAAGPSIIDETVTATNPTICPNKTEEDTGLGWEADTVHIVLGGADEYDFSTTALEMNANTLTEAGGIQINDDATVAFGTGSDVTMDWDNTRGALVTAPSGHYVSPEGISDRYRLTWVAGQRGKPGINADILNAAEATRMVTDPDFEVLGTAGSSDDITFYAEGGITIETDGTDGNGTYICPHLDANQSAWTQVTWGTDKEVRWEAHIRTGAAITTCIIYAGLKLTGTDVVATDADQVFFRYEDAVNDGEWQAVNSIADSDDAHDTNVVVAINTDYHLVIEINSSRVAKFYINGTLVETSAALTDAVDFIPYISIEEDGASAARTLHVKGQAISRAY